MTLSCRIRPTSTPPRRLVAGLVPLLLSLAVHHAWAGPLMVRGSDGAKGADATGDELYGGVGADGGGARFASRDQPSTIDWVEVTGGSGGTGGAPQPGKTNSEGWWEAYGIGGNGGNGGWADGFVTTVSGLQTGNAVVTVTGGGGGHAGPTNDSYDFTEYPLVGRGGQGGGARGEAIVYASGAAAVNAQATAVGGAGGNSGGSWNGRSGNGGTAQAQAYGSSDTGDVRVAASVKGGNGGNVVGNFGVGGRGAAVTLTNAVQGSTRGALTQIATAGDGGRYGSPLPVNNPDSDLDGAGARSTLVLSDASASALAAHVAATGGAGIDGVAGGAGGSGYAALTLSSSRGGVHVDGTVTASGGAGGSAYYWNSASGHGGAADAFASLSGLSSVSGRVAATGADGAFANAYGGSANASLTVNALGLARGEVAAYGGLGSGDILGRFREDGAASATLTLVGAGAQAGAIARGAGAASIVNVISSGAQAVDVTSAAIGGYSYGWQFVPAVTSSVTVNAGAGGAAVSAVARADSANSTLTAMSNLVIAASGDISGGSYATGTVLREISYAISTDAISLARGETSGSHSVTLNAVALANGVDNRGGPALFGTASADAYGRSGSGLVAVRAEARGGFISDASNVPVVRAHATAVTQQVGGVSTATAVASGGSLEARAQALAVNGAGAQVSYAGSAIGGYGGYASGAASSQYSADAFALPSLGQGTFTVANVSAAPADPAALPLGPSVAALASGVVGIGVHAAGNELGSERYEYTPTILQTSTGEFQFATAASEHVLIGFVSSTFLGGGFDLLDLAILNNGIQVFSQSFTSLGEANLFFNDHVLDLGAFGAGTQNLSIASTLTFAPQSAYAFNYVIGVGDAAGNNPAAVPEASSWLLMLAGLNGMLLIARRRRGGRKSYTGESQ